MLRRQGSSPEVRITTNKVRVDLGVTEAALRAVPGVEAATVATRRLMRGASLVAFVTPPHLDTQPLLQALRAGLHDYYLPDFVVPVAELPEGSGQGKLEESLDQRLQVRASARYGLFNSPS